MEHPGPPRSRQPGGFSPGRVVLLRILGPLFGFACFAVLLAVGISQRNLFGFLLFLALALAYGVRVLIRLRRTRRQMGGGA